jgi:HEAT repeat protein
MLDPVAEVLNSQDIRFKSAAALSLGSAGHEAKKYGDAIAALLQDTSEDRSQLIYTIAGIERRCPAVLRIPACASSCALAQIDGEKYTKQILKLLDSKVPEVKIAAVTALGDIGADYNDALCLLLDDSAPLIRASAACALGKIAKANGPDENVAERVAQALVDDSPIVKAASATALGQMGDEGAAFSDPVHDLFDDQSKAVRAAAVKAIGGIGMKGQTYAVHVARMMGDPEPVVRAAAVGTLPALGQRGLAFADEAAEMLYDQDQSVRDAAVSAMSQMGEAGQYYLMSAGAAAPMALTGE